MATEKTPRLIWVIGKIFFLCIFILGLFWFYESVDMVTSGIKTVGRVTDNIVSPKCSGGRSSGTHGTGYSKYRSCSYPLVEFEDLEGRKISAPGDHWIYGTSDHGRRSREDVDTNTISFFKRASMPTNSGDLHAEILNLVHSGQMIEAIKKYRQLHGVGLKEAKKAVEALSKG